MNNKPPYEYDPAWSQPYWKTAAQDIAVDSRKRAEAVRKRLADTVPVHKTLAGKIVIMCIMIISIVSTAGILVLISRVLQ